MGISVSPKHRDGWIDAEGAADTPPKNELCLDADSELQALETQQMQGEAFSEFPSSSSDRASRRNSTTITALSLGRTESCHRRQD